MHGDATTAIAEARPLTSQREAPQARRALGASQTARERLAAEDARLREAVRALLAAIDALP